MTDALFLLSLGALALCGLRRSRRPERTVAMPYAVRIRPALTPIDDLDPGDTVEDNDGVFTVCTPDGNLSRLAGRVLATLFADGLTATGPIAPGHGRPQWLLQQGLWVEA